MRELHGRTPRDILREVEKRAPSSSAARCSLHLTDKLKDGKLLVDQGVIAGCAGGMYDNIAEAAAILDGQRRGQRVFLPLRLSRRPCP